MRDATEQFRDAIRSAGFTPPDMIDADGKLHRFASNGKHGDDAGWYALHDDGIPAGAFGDWRSGFSQTWRADIGRTLTPAEDAAHRAKAEAIRRAREAETVRQRAKAAKKAAAIWNSTMPASDNHPYLTRKGIKAHGTQLHNGAIVVPLRDGGDLHSLQFIDADGDKKFLTGGRKSGCYFSIGTMNDPAVLCIAEGFATGASIHEATGYPVVVAFDAGNLQPVARVLRAKFPDLELIVCADDDAATEGNPGMTKATEAARFVGGVVAIPDFGPNRPKEATDFNDLATHRGAEAVRQSIAMALSETDVTDVTDVQASNGAESGVTDDNPADVTGVTGEDGVIPDADHRPAFKVFDKGLSLPGSMLRPGVWFFGIRAGRKSDDPPTPTQQWICSPLHIEAVSFDRQDNNFGRLLRFKNTLGRWREWAMPMELLRGAGDDLRGELLAMGVAIDPLAKNLLAQYLQSNTPKQRVHCALQVGWCGNSFVLPDAVIGPSASGVIFQSGERGHDEHTRGGTLAGWQAEISARAVGNPLLLLAISASFAGPMLARCNGESGGIHFVGDSSTGKTTVIEASCATWGGTNYRRSWRATANGMEGAAALFNDCLLALDEISECDPKEVGAIVYALGNGRGKQRASRTGSARSVTRWRCFVLSSGERTIGTTMMDGGYRAKAGQAVRLLDIPAARRFGAFDELHGLPNGAAFADAIRRAALAHHGHAGRAFLEKLTRDTRDFCEWLERFKALPEFSAEGSEGQDKRTAARFALLALAGEVATEYGITGWPEGAAIEAAAEGFKSWRSMRGRGNDERRQILEQVSGFIERHGDSRFSSADGNTDDDAMRINRAGWWRDDGSERVYLFNKDGMREALKGFDFKRALDTLQQAGALPEADSSGERAKAQRIGGRLVRLYPIKGEKLGADHGT
jgi:putative DNA primase/helicase